MISVKFKYSKEDLLSAYHSLSEEKSGVGKKGFYIGLMIALQSHR